MPPKTTKTTKTTKIMAYCVKCKEKREMKDATEAVAKNGRKMMKGTCPVCGTKMNLFVKC
jgi:hypothetical protein